jgi:glucokinase
LIYGLPHFDETQQVVLQAAGPQEGPIAVLGAGTGLGMARGIRTEGGLIALASEGGIGNSPREPKRNGNWPAG